MSWQPSTVVYPDIELELTGRLRAAFAARNIAVDWIGNTVPNPRRGRMVVVRRDGGTQSEMRDRPRVTLRVWAKTEAEADELARLVMALGASFADGDPIIGVPLIGRSGPYPVVDESEDHVRAMSIEFHTRGVQV